VPPGQSRAVADEARKLVRVLEVKDANHNDRALLDGEELISAIVELADGIRPETS
jgi:hypothetical protein